MRIVVKVGTSTLAWPTGRLNIRRVEALCRVLSDLKNAGHELLLVSSGSIGMGWGRLGMRERPQDMPTKQAAAAVGQCELMYVYDKLFSEYHHVTAQVLLSGDDIHDARRSANVRNTLRRLLELQVLPILNENDAVSIEEIGISTTIGENDTLSAIVAELVQADLLILLSDIDGLYTADPHQDPEARLITVVDEISPELFALAGGKGSSLGSGGMITKLKAGQICMAAGCDMIIANGSRPEDLYGIMDGKQVGTRFRAPAGKT